MVIACLGWGSLIWRPGALPVRATWFSDGPLLPIEFARESTDSRITLVLATAPPVAPVRSLWALMSIADLDTAKRELSAREGTLKKGEPTYVGWWTPMTGNQSPSARVIGAWGATKGLDAIIWTDLPPKFAGQEGRVPTADELITHLRNLPHEKRKNAEEYIRRAPAQIDTAYRRRIEAELGWRPTAAEPTP